MLAPIKEQGGTSFAAEATLRNSAYQDGVISTRISGLQFALETGQAAADQRDSQGPSPVQVACPIDSGPCKVAGQVSLFGGQDVDGKHFALEKKVEPGHLVVETD